ncbi:AraC family transcriptional regulator [Rhodoblastus sp. 17X3]|uniref:AraC family transcriptional regulator n=1 Tax=Rhodoblastus sp. 17X3 TaxID=3047026 RepID=UPI0024B6D67C|nr:AraC family transcriptional regulator [Rhodoblastus sp. 17X3]MDI9847309.1 AraC family transcriptional regulator [Rhodoblastus sp. 17X3]
MTDLIRSGCLTHFADVARSVGIDPALMLRNAGLPPTSLQAPDIKIAAGGVGRLLEASAAAAAIDDFGLRLAERGGLSNLGPVALVVREQPTVGAAMEAIARYIHIHNESLNIRIEDHGDFVAITPTMLFGQAAPARQAIELTLGVLYRILSAFLGPGWRPLDVQFTHPPPRNRETYRRFFACNVAFGAEYDAIVCPISDMDRPMQAADALMARYAQNYVEAIAAGSPDMAGKVRELVAALLPTGRCSAEIIAGHLGCDRRTVHRRLAACGTTFSDILDEQRAALVLRLIEDCGRSLQAVAEILGFSAQSALARWFKERFGCSMTQWRAAHFQIPRPETLNHPASNELSERPLSVR